jgi:outer membrane protein assembly factor BamB
MNRPIESHWTSRIAIGAFLSCVLLISGGRGEVSSEDWPSFRGNPQLTGVATGKLPDNPKLLWTYQTEEGIESTAAIAGKTVYVGSWDGHLYAVDLLTGELRWKYKASNEIKSSPSVFGEVVYFGDETGDFHAVDAKSGAKLWVFRTEAGIISSANFAGDRVIFGSYDQYLYCLSAADGSLIWKFQTEGYVHGTPAVSNGVAVITGCDSYLRLVSLESGKEEKSIELGDYVAASPATLDHRAYAGTFGNRVVGIDLQDAKILWRYENPKKQFPFYSSAAITNDVIIVGGRDKMIHALKPETGDLLWTYPVKSRVDSSPVIVEERAFFGTTGGVILGLNIHSAEKVWEFVTGSSITASPSVGGGKLVIGSDDGILYCFGKKEDNE